MGSIGEAAKRLPHSVAVARDLPAEAQPAALHEALLADIHDPVVGATSEGDDVPEHELRGLAEAVRLNVPAGTEDSLTPRERVFVRLLRSGALGAAWTLAQDNGSGKVQQRVSFSTSSGAARTSVALPLATVSEGDRLFAWLPGFRDPRWSVPDEVYDVGADVVMRSMLEQVLLSDGRLLLAGWAHLDLLATSPDDCVTVLLEGPDAQVRVGARRVRRPDLVKGTRAELTRLAWAGWSAEVDLAAVGEGEWRALMEICHDGLCRAAPLGAQRGPLAETRLTVMPHEVGRRVYRAIATENGALVVRAQSLTGTARTVPRSVRTMARRLVPRR